jgi:hypothetical protein
MCEDKEQISFLDQTFQPETFTCSECGKILTRAKRYKYKGRDLCREHLLEKLSESPV